MMNSRNAAIGLNAVEPSFVSTKPDCLALVRKCPDIVTADLRMT